MISASAITANVGLKLRITHDKISPRREPRP